MKGVLSGWLICTLVHWAWNPCVSLYLEKAAFWAQSGEAIGFFSVIKGACHLGIFFLHLGVFLLGLLDTNCISWSSNKWHQSWSHLSMAHRKEQGTGHLVVDFFFFFLFSRGTTGRAHFVTELQVTLAAKINYLKILTVLFTPFTLYGANTWLKKK